MADAIPPSGQAAAADLAAVHEALTGQGQVIGGIQSALAGAVDAQLAANQQAISAARARLTKTANRAGRGQGGMVNGLAGMLGETIATSIAPGELAQQQIGTFAATGAVQPRMPLSGPTVPILTAGGATYALIGTCTQGPGPATYITQLFPNGTIDPPPPSGWTDTGIRLPDPDPSSALPLPQRAQLAGQQWIADSCQTVIPPPPPALPPVPPPVLPPAPPPSLPPAIPPPQTVTTDPVSGAFCVCPLTVPPLVAPPAEQTITKGFTDMADWLAALGDSILRAGSFGGDAQEGGREWIDACVWDPLARLVVRHFDRDDGPTMDVIKLMSNSQSCLLSNIYTKAVANYIPGTYPDKARAVMAVKNVLESLLAASVDWASSGSTSYHAGAGLDAAGSIPPPAKPPKPPKVDKKSKRTK